MIPQCLWIAFLSLLSKKQFNSFRYILYVGNVYIYKERETFEFNEFYIDTKQILCKCVIILKQLEFIDYFEQSEHSPQLSVCYSFRVLPTGMLMRLNRWVLVASPLLHENWLIIKGTTYVWNLNRFRVVKTPIVLFLYTQPKINIIFRRIILTTSPALSWRKWCFERCTKKRIYVIVYRIIKRTSSCIIQTSGGGEGWYIEELRMSKGTRLEFKCMQEYFPRARSTHRDKYLNTPSQHHLRSHLVIYFCWDRCCS